MAQQVKNPPAVQETQETRAPSLGREDPMEKEMATHSRILAWRIPWTEESDRLQFMGSQTVGQDWACTQKVNKGENNQDNKCELALPWCLGENPWGLWKTRDCPREEGCLFNSSWSLLLGDLSSRWPDLQSPFFVLLFFFFKRRCCSDVGLAYHNLQMKFSPAPVSIKFYWEIAKPFCLQGVSLMAAAAELINCRVRDDRVVRTSILSTWPLIDRVSWPLV